MTSRPLAPTLALALAAATGALAGCAKPPEKKALPPIAVAVATLHRGTIATYDRLNGQVTPYLQSSLSTQQAGTILSEFANEGDRVRAGEVLAKIDDAPLQATLEEQRGSAEAARAKLDQSQIQQPITNQQYATGLDQARQAYRQAAQQRASDRARLRTAQLLYKSNQQLVSQGFVAQTAFETTRSSYIAAERTLEQDQAKVLAAQSVVDQAQRNLLNTPLQRQVVAENRGSLTQANGAMALTQTNIGQTTLAAPFDGIVTSRLLDPGAYAGPMQPLFQISQLDPVYVDFNVKDDDLAHTRPGTVVSFRTNANPNRRYSATVTSVNAVPTTGTLLYRARLTVRNPDLALRGGMLVTVRVLTAEHRDVLLAQRGAVDQNDGRGMLYIVASATPARAGDAPSPAPSASPTPHFVAKHVTATVGLETDAVVEVKAPALHEGTRVITSQVGTLHDGAAVAPHS